MAKKNAKTGRRKKHVTEIVATHTSAAVILTNNKRDSLVTWYELYLGTQVVDPETNTFKAQKNDLQKFVGSLLLSSRTDYPDQ